MHTELIPFPSDAVTVKDGHPATTSLRVSEVFGRRHKHVLDAIKALDCSEEFRQPNFRPATYLDAQGKARPMVELTKDGFVFAVMGFTGAKAARFKEAYIAAFNAMEAEMERRAARDEASLPPPEPPRKSLTLQEYAELLEYKVRALELEPRVKRQAFTADERQRIRALAQAGVGVEIIAQRCNRTPASITAMLWREKTGRKA